MPEPETFKIGDVVEFKAGGSSVPQLVITDYKELNTGKVFICKYWESKEGVFKTSEFPGAALTKVG